MYQIPIVIKLSKPLQISALIETETFPLRAFIDFAEKSVANTLDISGSCAKNAEVCHVSGLYQSAQTWRLLSTVFFSFPSKNSASFSENGSTLNAMNILLPILNYYAESSNSQMCVALYSLFNGFAKFKEYCADRVLIWYDSYIGMY